MLKVNNKERLRQLIEECTPDEDGRGLVERLAYLASYGTDDVTVVITPDSRDPYISVAWYRGEKLWMNGALVPHDEHQKVWGVHT